MNDQLWEHEQREIARHTAEPHWFLFWDPRTGKTRTCVYEIALWIKQFGVRKVLVVAPVDGCKVWLKDDELGSFDPAQVRVINLSTDDSIRDRITVLATLDDCLPTIVVVNRDVIFKASHRRRGEDEQGHPQFTKLTGLQIALTKWGPQAVILDECHDYRHIGSKRARAAEQIAKRAHFRRGLSGTPDPTNYVDFYAQFKIIAPEVFGTRKKDFEERYVEYHPLFPNTVKRYKNVEELRAKLLSKASVVFQRDCFDMPEILPDIFIDVAFNRIARELYRELTENLIASFLGLEINATHQLAKLAILHQLAAGFVRDTAGNAEWIFEGKIKAAHRYIEEMMRADKRVVVYHHYKPEGWRLYTECIQKYGASAVGALHGGTPRPQRSPHPFADRPELRIFIAQEDTAQLSISLKESDHVLWYSWGPEYDVNHQARQRIFDERVNKPHGLSYTFLRVPDTVDAFMSRAVSVKREASQQLLDCGFRNAALGKIPWDWGTRPESSSTSPTSLIV